MVDGGAGTLPGIERSIPDQIVIHADMDCFYAACERLREPALRNEPVVVGMGYEPESVSGVVATASYEARTYGVESAQPIDEALERLPRKVDAAADPALDVDAAGFYRPVDMDYYRTISSEVMTIFEDVADTVRAVSIDEAYLDVTSVTDWDRAAEFGRRLVDRIENDVGVVASIGIAPTLAVAKIASDYDKPAGLVVVPPNDVRDFLAPLSIDTLQGVGPVTARALREDGIETVGDLATADRHQLRKAFGERGEQLYWRARGIDDRPVEPRGRPKSLSRESSLGGPTDDVAAIRSKIESLAAAVADRAARKRAFYRTIGIKVVTPPFEVNTRERSLPGPVEDPALVESIALDLFEEFHGQRVRKVGVRVSNLSFADEDQAELDAWEGPPADPPIVERSPVRRGQRSLDEFE